MAIKTKLPFLLFFDLLIGTNAFAAACCGGGFAAPALLVGDDKAQLTSSYSYSTIASDVGTDSLWRKRISRETTETYKIEAAHIFWDRWQAGFSVPLLRRARSGNSSTGLGDTNLTLGYEYLPDWDYSPWRPKGIGFLQLTLPTGRSVDETNDPYQLDSRGRGFYALGLGTFLTKILGSWDLFSTVDLHHSFSKKYSNSSVPGTLKPGWGGNFGMGAGFNFSSVRLGSSLTWSYEDPVAFVGNPNSKGAAQRYATANLSASYLFANEWAGTLSYLDQTLFGSPTNTSLGRGGVLSAQKRWLR